MGTTRFEVMKQTALFILDSLPEATQLGLGSIDGDCWTEPKAWDAVGALSRYDMRYRLRFLVPNGTTPLLERLQASPELFSDDAQTRKSIFLISDGANVCRADGEDICEWASRLSSRKITINILTFLDATESNTNAFAEYTCLIGRKVQTGKTIFRSILSILHMHCQKEVKIVHLPTFQNP